MQHSNMDTKKNKTQSIISAGHHYWIDEKGNEHITFFDNEFGRKLKKMWGILHKPTKVVY